MKINKWVLLIVSLYIIASGVFILRSLSIDADTPAWALKYNVSSSTDNSRGSNDQTVSGEETDALSAATQDSTAQIDTPQSTAAEGSGTQSSGKLFTVEQLKAANGVNGAPAYIAYHGKVYDLAGDPAFVNGVHKYDPNIKAGIDLTYLFDNQAPSSHQAKNYMSRLKEIGSLSTAASSSNTGTSSANTGTDSAQAETKVTDTKTGTGTGTGAGTNSTSGTPAPTKPSTPAVNSKTITLAQLKAANGKNGAPAYIAYHGKVYDLAGDPAFINGVHKYDRNIKAGMDLTDLFDNQAPSSHQANNYISRLMEVGILNTAAAGANSGPPAGTGTSTGTGTGTKGTSSSTASPEPAVNSKTFTEAQLKAANGQNGAPAYIAYHGKVYDVSGDSAFVNGVHKYDRNIKAGMDLTNLFDTQAPSSHRANDYISRLKLVGAMDASYVAPAASPNGSSSGYESEEEDD